MNGTVTVKKADALYMAVYNACEGWAQTRINEIERNGEFQIGDRLSNRTTLVVSNTTLIHIEKGSQGLRFIVEKRSCWSKNFVRDGNGAICHWGNLP